MKKTSLALLLPLLFYSCDLFSRNSSDEEPSYTAKIAWDSGLNSNYFGSTLLDGDSLYFYECPPGYNTVNIYTLTKLDASTGALIWRSSEFTDIAFCPPVALESYIYVFLQPNFILCFYKETGKLTAIARANIEGNDSEMRWNVTGYGHYLYFGLRGNNRCFVRLDINDIDYNNPQTIQEVVPEILWKPETGNSAAAIPVVYNNVVYICTRSSWELEVVELAGFNIDTKEMVFYQTFGGIEDVNAGYTRYPENGAYNGSSPILIHDGILYYISRSIAAWNLKTGERLYRHVFPNDIPNANMYNSNTLMQAVYYNGKIYYTSNAVDDEQGYRNTHCIDAKTGKLVWNSVAKGSVSLRIIPIIAHGRMYVSESIGLRVYNPQTGKLIGVDKSFRGGDMDRTVLYGDYMICERYDKGYKKVAVDVGK